MQKQNFSANQHREITATVLELFGYDRNFFMTMISNKSTSGINLVKYYKHKHTSNDNENSSQKAAELIQTSSSPHFKPSRDHVSNRNCSVCLNPLKSYPSAQLPCNHRLHIVCIFKIDSTTISNNHNMDLYRHHESVCTQLKCPLCFPTTYPEESVERFLIEGCRCYDILKWQTKYIVNSVSSNATSSPAATSSSSTKIVLSENERKSIKEDMVRQWRRAALRGNAQAQMNLAHIYNHGDCVSQNFHKAAFWYQKQVNKGDARAQFRLARLYSNDQGVAKDSALAASLFKLSARQGYPKAQLCYGTMLLHGQGCEKNTKEASDWLKKAADQGNEEAEIILGNLLVRGNGVDQNEREGFNLILADAVKGNINSFYQLGELYLHGHGCDQNEAEAAIWFGKAANENHLESKFRLGQMFLNGIGVDQNHKNALKWFKEAADDFHPAAQCALADMFLNREAAVIEEEEEEDDDEEEDDEVGAADVHEDIEESSKDINEVSENSFQYASSLYRSAAVSGSSEAEFKYGQVVHQRQGVVRAIRWYIKAAEQNHLQAAILLANIYYFGEEEGIQQSYHEAAKWYRIAANLNCPESQRRLGFMLYNGLGLKHTFKTEAAKWYRKSATLGDDKAQHYLGKMLVKGIGVESNYEEGINWLRESAIQGNVDAQYHLCQYLLSPQLQHDLPKNQQKDDQLLDDEIPILKQAEAIKWCREAVRNGHVKAQILLPKIEEPHS